MICLETKCLCLAGQCAVHFVSVLLVLVAYLLAEFPEQLNPFANDASVSGNLLANNSASNRVIEDEAGQIHMQIIVLMVLESMYFCEFKNCVPEEGGFRKVDKHRTMR